MCVYTHAYVSICVHWYMFVCMWRLEVSVKCLPLLHSTLLEMDGASLWTWPSMWAYQKPTGSSCLSLLLLGSQECVSLLAVCMGAGDWTLRTSFSHSKQFTDWTISSPSQIYIQIYFFREFVPSMKRLSLFLLKDIKEETRKIICAFFPTSPFSMFMSFSFVFWPKEFNQSHVSDQNYGIV